MRQGSRNQLTDYWQEHKITKEKEFAILTDLIHQEWSVVSVKEHKSETCDGAVCPVGE